MAKKKRGDDLHELGEPHQAAVRRPAQIARDQPYEQPDGRGGRRGGQPHRQRGAGPVDYGAEQVAAQGVGAHQVGPRGPGQRRARQGEGVEGGQAGGEHRG